MRVRVRVRVHVRYTCAAKWNQTCRQGDDDSECVSAWVWWWFEVCSEEGGGGECGEVVECVVVKVVTV